MVRLTCLVRRKPGMTPAEFHRYWAEVHGPLVAATKSGSYALRYEQHHRPLSDYASDDEPGYDGVTLQWFESKEAFLQSIREDDYRLIDEDMRNFLDLDAIQFVLTEEPVIVVDGDVPR